jgi:uncharacterized protein YehS (DUF1456 family)
MNNYCLRRLRYALSLDNQKMLAIFQQANYKLSLAELKKFLLKEDEKGFIELPDYLLVIFLDGLILDKRGPREGEAELSQAERVESSKKQKLNNNVIVNKIKIALSIKADDLIAILELADFRISKSEISAFFRKPAHRNYRECGNQFLRNLLTGLTEKYRAKKNIENAK